MPGQFMPQHEQSHIGLLHATGVVVLAFFSFAGMTRPVMNISGNVVPDRSSISSQADIPKK
jgi:hypothetical protein